MAEDETSKPPRKAHLVKMETGDMDELRGDVIASLDERNRAWEDLQRRGDRLEAASKELGERAAARSKKPDS